MCQGGDFTNFKVSVNIILADGDAFEFLLLNQFLRLYYSECLVYDHTYPDQYDL